MKKTFISACLASAAFSLTNELPTFDLIPNGWQSIQITHDGEPKTLYVASDSYSSSGNRVTIPYNNRALLSQTPYMDPAQFYKPNLLGGSVEYDVDLSGSNCGCVAAFYLVGAPGKDRNGNYWNTDGYYYCDGNQVGGNYCPEYDIMEANQWVSQTTVHACDAPDGKGFYYNCNRGGTCITNTKDKLGYNDFGPGS
jgi:hypothetical protein